MAERSFTRNQQGTAASPDPACNNKTANFTTIPLNTMKIRKPERSASQGERILLEAGSGSACPNKLQRIVP